MKSEFVGDGQRRPGFLRIVGAAPVPSNSDLKSSVLTRTGIIPAHVFALLLPRTEITAIVRVEPHTLQFLPSHPTAGRRWISSRDIRPQVVEGLSVAIMLQRSCLHPPIADLAVGGIPDPGRGFHLSVEIAVSMLRAFPGIHQRPFRFSSYVENRAKAFPPRPSAEP